MQRRSTRSRQHPPEITTELPSALEKPKGKKRKAEGSTSEDQPRPKKLRGKRGILQKMIEMPLDLLFEIFGRLEPLDLLHLARTSKDLRALLMNRSSSSLWRTVRANICGLPECPEDLSEPQYADLLFGKYCQMCGGTRNRGIGALNYSWSARIRVCTACVSESSKFVRRDYQSSHLCLKSRSVLEIPYIQISNKGIRQEYVCSEFRSIWQAEYKAARDKDQWLEDKFKERKIIAEHAEACLIWFQDLQDQRQRDKESAIDDRKAFVLQHLKKLGWEDELNKMGPYDPKIEDQPVIVKACKKNITPHVLSDLEVFMNQFMERQKTKRLDRERRVFLKRRLFALRKTQQTYASNLPANVLYPSTGELFRIPAIRDMVYDENSYPSLEVVVLPMLPDLTVQWQKHIEAKLLDLIKLARPDCTFDPDLVFSLATTSFTCTSCARSGLRYPAVLIHPCATKKTFQPLDFGTDSFYLNDILEETFWNGVGAINYFLKNAEAVTEVLKIAGFDPMTTTAAEMDRQKPIFECVKCNDAQDGRATFSWMQAAMHIRNGHLDPSSRLELMTEEDAVIVRARMKEEMDKLRARTYVLMVCAHCKKKDRFLDLKKHVKADHGKSRVTDEDIVPEVGRELEEPVFRLWPPREDE